MTFLPGPTGPTKGDIVRRAYGMCGQAFAVFDLEAEDMSLGVQCLDDAMATLGPNSGYNTPEDGASSSQDRSGLAPGDVLGAAVMTARLLAPSIGKTLSLTAVHARAESTLIAKSAAMPQIYYGRNTIRGAGNRRTSRWGGPFFPFGPPPTPDAPPPVTPIAPTPTPPLTPAPTFLTQPGISPAGGSIGTTFTAQDATASNATAITRRWLLSGTAIATTATVTPNTAGTLVLENTATGPGGVTIATSASVTVAALIAPTIAFANPSQTVTEGNSGTTSVTSTINVTRNSAVGPLTIALTYGGTATPGSDYVAGPTSLTIGAGQSSGSFDLQINGDTTAESDETIVINAALQGYSATASKTIIIANDDSSGSAAFTSPATRTQPSGTRRAFLVSANMPGKFTRGSGQNAADFADPVALADGKSALFILTAAAAALLDPTVAGAKALPVNFTPSNAALAAVSQTVTVQLTQSVAPSTTSVSYIADFTAAAGTALDALPGWAQFATTTIDGNLKPKTDGSGALQGHGQSFNDAADRVAYLHDLGQALAGFTVKYRFGSNGGNGWLGMYVAADGAANGVQFESLLLSGGLNNSTYYRQASTGTNDAQKAGVNSAAPRPDGSFDFTHVFSADGKKLTTTQTGYSNGADVVTSPVDFDLTGLTLGTKIGLSGHGGGGGGQCALDNPFRLLGLTAVKAATTLVVTDSPVVSSSERSTHQIAWGLTKPLGYQAKGTDPDSGALVIDWITCDWTIADDGTSSATVSSPTENRVLWHFRPINDVAIEAVAPNPTAHFVYTPSTSLGANLSFIYDGMDWFRDLSYQMQLVTGANRSPYVMPLLKASDGNTSPTDQNGVSAADELGMGMDGIIRKLPAGGIEFAYNNRVAPTRAGAFEIVYTPSDGKSTLRGATTDANGRQVLAINMGGWDQDLHGVYVNAHIDGTCPPEGISPKTPYHPGNFSFRKKGDTSTLLCTDEHIADLRTVGAVRMMTPAGINMLRDFKQRLDSTMIWAGMTGMQTSGDPIMPVWQQVQMANEAKVDLWYNWYDYVDDSYRTAVSQYIAAKLDPSLTLHTEDDNEVWGGSGTSIYRHMANGVAQGYHTPNADGPKIGVVCSNTTFIAERSLIGRGNYPAYTFTGMNFQPADGATVTITDPVAGTSRTYKFQATLTNVDGNVKIGATPAATAANFYAAVGLYTDSTRSTKVPGTPGTDYAQATTENASVFFFQNGGLTGVYAELMARSPGQAGNQITLTGSSGALTASTPALVTGQRLYEVTTGAAFNAGDYVFFHDGATASVFKALVALKAGDLLNDTSKCSVYATGDQMVTARERSHVATTMKEVAALRSAFGSRASQVVPITGVWYLNSAQQIVDKLKFGKAYLNGGYYAPANYLTGVTGAGVSSVDYNAPDYAAGNLGYGSAPWTKTERNLASSNQAAFLNAFFAFVPFAIKAEMNYLAALKTKVEQLLRAQCPDYVPNSVNMAAYEGMQFDAFANYPVDVGTLTQAVRRDPRYTATIRTALDLWRTMIGGPSMQFDLTSVFATGWGMMTYTGDTASPARKAFADFKAANGYPAIAPGQ